MVWMLRFTLFLSIMNGGVKWSPCVYSTLMILPKAMNIIAVIGSTWKIPQQQQRKAEQSEIRILKVQ